MLKLFENRFINTTNKLAISIEDIKRGRFGGEDKGRDSGGGGGGGGACGMTHDVMSVLTEQHNSLLLVLATQTQKLDNLEQVCLHHTRSDEQRECSGAGEPPRSEFAPKIEEILQTVVDLKERLAEAGAEVLDLRDDLEEERSRVEELQGKLRSAQQALDERALDRRSLGNELKIERFQAHCNTLHQQPFFAKATDGMSQGTPTALHMQVDSTELVQTSDSMRERGRGRDTERRVSSSRARPSLSLQSDMTGLSRSKQSNQIIQDIDLFRASAESGPDRSILKREISAWRQNVDTLTREIRNLTQERDSTIGFRIGHVFGTHGDPMRKGKLEEEGWKGGDAATKDKTECAAQDTATAHAACVSGGRLSCVQSDICMDLNVVLDGQPHVCVAVQRAESRKGFKNQSSQNIQAHACIRDAKNRRQRDEPVP
jgi:hypothetical protein